MSTLSQREGEAMCAASDAESANRIVITPFAQAAFFTRSSLAKYGQDLAKLALVIHPWF